MLAASVFRILFAHSHNTAERIAQIDSAISRKRLNALCDKTPGSPAPNAYFDHITRQMPDMAGKRPKFVTPIKIDNCMVFDNFIGFVELRLGEPWRISGVRP